MRNVFEFRVEPKGDNYNNTSKGGIVLNTNIEDHKYVNRIGVVKSIPISFNSIVEVGDEVIVHHNVFRRFHAMDGSEKENASVFKDNEVLVNPDQLFFVKKEGEWVSFSDRCMVAPVVNKDRMTLDKTSSNIGILLTGTDALKELKISPGDTIGFTDNCEYEFTVDGQLFYCIRDNDICIKYDSKRNEVKYNNSWAESSR